MVKVLRSFVRGPLEPHAAGFAKERFGRVIRARRPSSMFVSLPIWIAGWLRPVWVCTI